MASCPFNFTIQYIKGKKNIIADALSRCRLEKYNTTQKSFLEKSNYSLPPTKLSILIITNSNFLQPPTIPIHSKMPARYNNIAGPSTAPHWQTMNYDYWNHIPVEEESGTITTATVTTRTQERLVKEKSNNQNINNRKPREPEFNWEDYVQEEVWEEEPRSEWTTENNQEPITNNNKEEWED